MAYYSKRKTTIKITGKKSKNSQKRNGKKNVGKKK
jgi:hypothetical protein